jgi:peptide/nickel transport system substrate-binding protein
MIARFSRRAALALAAAMTLTPMVGERARAQQSVPEHRVLRIVPFADLGTLDPINTTAGNVQSHAMHVYDFLFGRDSNEVPRPQMVETFSVSDDGLTWTFRLRDGLAFHDGAAVTTADVVASLRRWGARDPYGRQLIQRTKEMATPDARTLVWTLTEPFALMLEALSKSTSNVPAIMPARIAATDPFQSITDPTGSGPFIFVREEWRPGVQIVYRRNPNYVPRSEPASGTAGGKVVNIDRLEWRIISDQQTAVLALINGDVDFLENAPVDFHPELKARGMRLVTTNTLGFQGMIRPNHLHPPFNDVRARRALLYLVDQQKYLTGMFGDPATFHVCPAFFNCGTQFETAAGAEPSFGKDPARARALLTEAGYKGEPIVLLHPTDIQFLSAATLLFAQDLRSIGVNVQLQASDFATMAQRRASRNAPDQGGWHLGLTWWNAAGSADPVGNVPMQASCERAWPGWPCSAEHQALIDAFTRTKTDAERKAAAARVQESAYRFVPYVPYGQWFQPVGVSPRLTGLLPVPGAMYFVNVAKAPR